MTSKHDKLEKLIAQDLHKRGWTDITIGEEYFTPGHCGEIDVYARKGKYWIDIEVKTFNQSKNRNKAINQLYRAKHHFFPKGDKVFLIYAHGHPKNMSYEYEWIKYTY